jgi:hypothetical protein
MSIAFHYSRWIFCQIPYHSILRPHGQAEGHLANWRCGSKPCWAIQRAEQHEEALTNSRPGLVQFGQDSVVLLNLCHDTINLTGALDPNSWHTRGYSNRRPSPPLLHLRLCVAANLCVHLCPRSSVTGSYDRFHGAGVWQQWERVRWLIWSSSSIR